MNRILIVEDETAISRLIEMSLSRAGYDCTVANDGLTAANCIENSGFDLALLDIMLPEEDGLTILKRLRESDENLPVMMLTAKSTEYDKVVGLDSGADDYLAKPFGMMELMARVKALLRRSVRQEEQAGQYSLGRLTLNIAEHTVKVDGENITLTLKEFELLQLLLEHKGMVFSRDQLLNRVWGYAFDGENRTVDVHIRTLRQKLGPCGDYIETVRGVGYKIGGDIT